MRKLVFTALIAATALTGAAPGAMAQSNQELRRDRQDIRQEQRELRDAQRYGDRRDVREQRHDVREARQEYREDLRDTRDRRWRNNDWQDWRRHRREEFRGGAWSAPFRYNSFRVGARIGRTYFDPRFVIADPWRYHLPAAVGPQRWVRHYNDLLLVDVRRGVVLRVLRNFYW